MRGSDVVTGSMFAFVDIEARIREDHPIRTIRRIVNDTLASLDADFEAMYSDIGRPSIAPERLLRGSLVQIFSSIRVVPEARSLRDAAADGTARL